MNPLNRRKFVSVALKSSGAMLLQFHFPAYADADAENKDSSKLLTNLDKNSPQAVLSNSLFTNGWLEITPDNQFIFTLDKAELGQNVITSLTAIMAEELDIDLDLLTVQFPKLSSHEGNPHYQPSWGTGGSSSVRIMWMPLRHAGAASKALFLASAAIHWNTTKKQISCKNGIVYNTETKQQLSFAELIPVASKMDPVDYQLKDINQFTQLGKPLQRQDIVLKTTGATRYGIDTHVHLDSLAQPLGQALDNAKQSDSKTNCAVLVRSPTIGGTIKTYNTSNTLKQAGVHDVVTISNGIAVIAETYWQAKKAAALLNIEWQEANDLSISDIQKQLKETLNTEGITARDKGNSAKALADAESTISASYSVPLLAHAPLEPMNCTAWFHDSVCEIWAPTQRPLSAQKAAQKVCGYSIDKIIVHTSFIGGGFGRRLSQDYVTEAVEIAQQLKYPIKIIWSREEDMQHGNFRPAVTSRFTANINSDGSINAWSNDIAALAAKPASAPVSETQTIKQRVVEIIKLGKARLLGAATINNTTVEGANEIPYRAENIALSYRHLSTVIPIGAWRSVGHSYNGFFVESFIDELAHSAGKDPIDYRLQVFDSQHYRLADTLKLAAKLAGWDTLSKDKSTTIKNNKKIYRGVACHSCFGSHVTEIIEISVEDAKPKIEQVYCVADCGFIVDPDGLIAQLEGAIIFGLSAALTGKIDIEKGRVVQSNFHDYPVMRINDSPNIKIQLVDNHEAPGGAGEIATPPAAPALANAWFAATGERVRDLPLIK